MLIKRDDGSRANYYTKGTVSMSVLSPGLLPYLHKRSCPVISDVRANVMLCLGACYLLVCACVFFIDEQSRLVLTLSSFSSSLCRYSSLLLLLITVIICFIDV